MFWEANMLYFLWPKNKDPGLCQHSVPIQSFQNRQTLEQFFEPLYPSAIATYFSLSDKSGTQGIFWEHIHAVDSWRKGPPRQWSWRLLWVACCLNMILSFNPAQQGFISLCPFIMVFSHWNQPCPNTKMWKVQPDLNNLGQPILNIIHLDTILCNAHLIGVCNGMTWLPYNFRCHDSLNSFKSFYVNKYIDYHAHEIAF